MITPEQALRERALAMEKIFLTELSRVERSLDSAIAELNSALNQSREANQSQTGYHIQDELLKIITNVNDAKNLIR